MEKDTVLEYFSQTRANLLKILGNLSPEIIVSAPVEGVWTIKDILGHITAWEIPLINPMQNLAAGFDFSPDIVTDGEKYNQDHAHKRENLSLNEIRKEMDEVRASIMETAARLPDTVWSTMYPAPWGGEDTLLRLIDGLAWHENEHTQTIKKWLGDMK